jgi:hypothetical protein
MSRGEHTTTPSCPEGVLFCLFVTLALVFVAGPAFAGTISVETGVGFHHSPHTEALFLRCQTKAFELFGLDTYYEGLAGAWNGKNRNEAVALSLGIMIPWHEDDHFFGSAGIGRASRTTDNLGVHFQFTFHVGYTMKFKPVNLSLGYVHFSTGKYFLGWDGPNFGENFLTAQAGWDF